MIKIYRQYQVINGYIQMPPNLESKKEAYYYQGNLLNAPVATQISASDLSDAVGTVKEVNIKAGHWVEFE